MKRFAVLLLTVLLLLPSCQRLPHREEDTAVTDASAMTFVAEDESASLVTIYSGTRYQVVPLVPQEGTFFTTELSLKQRDGTVMMAMFNAMGYILEDRIYQQSYDISGEGELYEHDTRWEIYDKDGNWLGRKPFYSFSDIGETYGQYDADGNYIVGFSERQLKKDTEVVSEDSKIFYIRKYDEEGKTLLAEAQYPMTKAAGTDVVLLSTDSPYYLLLKERIAAEEVNIYLIDKDLQLVGGPYEVHTVSQNFSANADGEVFMQDWQFVYRLNMQTGTFEQITPMYTVPLLTADGGVFQVTRDGVFSCDESEEKYLDWTASDLVQDDIDIIGGVDGNHLLVRNRCNLNLTEEFAILRRVGDEGLQRRLVTIGTYGSYVNTYLSRAVAVFNQTNEEYYVHLTETENTDAAGIAFTDSADFDTISALAARGELPDLQIFAQDFLSMDGDDLYTRLVDHGYLADIASLDGGQAILDSLTGSARRVGLYGGSTYRVPVYMRYQTILSRTAEPLTVETLTGAAASLQTGQTLFPQLHPEFFILESMIPQLFTDRANGTNTMDSAQFLAYLEMLQKVYTSSGGHGYVECGYTGAKPSYSVQYQKLMEEFSDGTVRYIPCTLAAVDGLGAYKLAFPDGQYCGYPDAPAVVSGLCSFGIYKDAKNPEGALAFLRYLLSDTVQNAAIVSEYNFPVTRAAIENELAYDHYVYYATVQNLDNRTDDAQFRAYCEEKWTGEDPKNGVRSVNRQIVPYTDADRAILQNITENAAVTTPDPTLTGIIREEVDAYIGGARDAAETARVLKSRVEVYLGEKK